MTLHSTFLKPQYNAQSFADLPSSLTYWLTGTDASTFAPHVIEPFKQSYDRVILLFIDSFGWRYLADALNRYPFLQRFERDGVITPITSMFPSTTAAHVTCIHTGLPPARSGLFEWQYYDPVADHIIRPLRYAFNVSQEWHSLENFGIKPKQIYPPHTLYQTLARHGVTSHVFQFAGYANSEYSKWVCREATIHPYHSLPEALVNLRHLLSTEKKLPAYYVLYFSMVDSIGHLYGPPTPHVEAEIDTLFTTLERIFMQRLSGRLDKTLLLLTADHGMIEADPKQTIYLNKESWFTDLRPLIKRNQHGLLIAPAGSPRDMFLYIKEKQVTTAIDLLRHHLADKAVVVETDELIAQGYFGPNISQTFLNRVGNVVILPVAGETIWWYEKDHFEMKFLGHHGGLTAPEMEIPLMLYEL